MGARAGLRPARELDLNQASSALTTYAGLLLRYLLDYFHGDVAKAVGAYNGGVRNPNGQYEAGVREAFPQLGELRIGRVRPRRRRRSALKRRRPSISFRRATGRIGETMPVHRGEREIIARN